MADEKKEWSKDKCFMRGVLLVTLVISVIAGITKGKDLLSFFFALLTALFALLAYLTPSPQGKDKTVYIVKQCPCCWKCSCMKCVEASAEHRGDDENTVETAVESSSDVAGDTPQTHQQGS